MVFRYLSRGPVPEAARLKLPSLDRCSFETRTQRQDGSNRCQCRRAVQSNCNTAEVDEPINMRNLWRGSYGRIAVIHGSQELAGKGAGAGAHTWIPRLLSPSLSSARPISFLPLPPPHKTPLLCLADRPRRTAALPSSLRSASRTMSSATNIYDFKPLDSKNAPAAVAATASAPSSAPHPIGQSPAHGTIL
jgi:hypothetical protein